jgi:biopolymer transport protein ExbD
LTIKVSADDVTLQGRRIASVTEALAQPENTLSSLQEELRYQASREPPLTGAEQLTGRPITIMGDETMPYKLLKRIMATCAQSDYRNIALAVNSVPPTAPGEAQIAAMGSGT